MTIIVERTDKDQNDILSEQCACMHCVHVVTIENVLDDNVHQIHPITEEDLAGCESRISFNHLLTMLVTEPTSSGKIMV